MTRDGLYLKSCMFEEQRACMDCIFWLLDAKREGVYTTNVPTLAPVSLCQHVEPGMAKWAGGPCELASSEPEKKKVR